uniref:biotin/lipoyl-containing protein n=1 Tax=Nakamurella sp. TaxID=1869182 RepID=UPI003B3BB3A5
MSDEWFVTMPKLGETVTEGELTTWLKNVGDPIAFDDPLFEVSTDKVDSEIPSPYDGVLAEILVPAGSTVPIGTQLARIVPEGAASGTSSVSSEDRLPGTGHHVAAAGGPALGDGAAPQMGGSEGPSDEAPGVSAPAGEVHDITMPKLGETVTEGELTTWLKNVGDAIEMDDPLFEVSTDKVDSESPSPYDGVLREILVPAGTTVPIGTPVARIGEAGAAVGGSSAPAAPASGSTTAGPSSSTSTTIVIGAKAEPGRMLSPLVRRLAAEHNLDVTSLVGSGAGGRIRRED